MQYVADFVYQKKFTGTKLSHGHDCIFWPTIIEDVKGYSDKISTLKIAVFEALTGKTVTIYKKKISPVANRKNKQ